MLSHKEGLIPRIAPAVLLACAGCLAPAIAPAHAAFPGDNGRLLFDAAGRGGDSDLWTIRPGGGKPDNLTAGSDATDVNGGWSPDGRRIVFMSDRETARNPDPKGSRGPDFELFVMRADGSRVVQVTDNEFDDEYPAWSPDGKRIVFARDLVPERGKVRYDIFTVGADGSGEKQITDHSGDDLHPTWSSRNKIAFASDRDGEMEIYSMSPSGKKLRKLTRNGVHDEFPDWSPDGRTVAFHSERGGNFDVYSVRAKGGGTRRLTRHADGEGAPAWSPDGRRLAFVRFSEKGPSIYTMRSSRRAAARLTPKRLEPFASDWQPVRRG